MDRKYIIVSFATPEYLKYKERVGPECMVEEIAGFKTKKSAYVYKPTFIKEKLSHYKKPVAWIDVDSIIHEKPEFDLFNFDVGFVHRESSDGVHPITSAFVLFNYTKRAFKFLEVWEYLCKNEDLLPFGDHIRMLTARYLMTAKQKLYREKNITDEVEGKITFNPGGKREYKC